MALIASVSGIRGTLGGQPGANLTPLDAVRYAAAYGDWVREQPVRNRIVLGRDARPSGPWLLELVANTWLAQGLEVVDLDLATTPSIALAVVKEDAGGGCCLTASHNPVEWNALKFFNQLGEFLTPEQGAEVQARYQAGNATFAPWDGLGQRWPAPNYATYHAEAVANHPWVDPDAISAADLYVALDPVNSSGAIYVTALLERLGVRRVTGINLEPHGRFAHNPEPIEAHLADLGAHVRATGAHLGLAVDPDVDRLALVDETGTPIGEEYTLVMAADYVLRHQPGPVVSNLSSSRALRVVAERHGCAYHASKVGEAHVVATMKAVKAILGGEGNGGIIVPDFHYGRDALIGIGILLTHVARAGRKLSELRAGLPHFHLVKHKAQLPEHLPWDTVTDAVAAAFPEATADRRDGLKLDLPHGWVHLRRSNTEPIVRLYAEAQDHAQADALAQAALGALEQLSTPA